MSRSKVKDLENQIDLYAYIQKNHNLTQLSRGKNYRVDPCPICSHREHFTVYPLTNSYSSFSSCCRGGSVYKYLIEVEKLSENEAYEKLKELAGVEDIKRSEEPYLFESATEPNDAQVDYTPFVEKGYAYSVKNYTKELLLFARERCISINEIVNYHLFVHKFKDGLRVVFPEWRDGKVISYSARALEGQEPKFKNSFGPKREDDFFGLEELFKDTTEPIILVESQINKLNLEYMGFRSISINGTENFQKFLEYISKNKYIDETTFVNAFDNDEAGRKTSNKSPFKSIKIPSKFNDINEWYVDSFKLVDELQDIEMDELDIYVDISCQLAAPTKKDSIFDYLVGEYDEDIKKIEAWSNIKTGFNAIDQHIGHIYPALYVIGGVPSIGKTTFIQQMSDGLIANDCDVIMFSYEQTKLELVNKAINRIKAIYQEKNPQLTDYDARKIYASTALNYSIVEANFKMTVDDMRMYLENYQRMNKERKVVVMIDYLQVVGSTNDSLVDKAKVDRNVLEIKTMSKELGIPIILISSLNRASYTTPIDFSSFKESGMIEYCADFLMGIQLSAVNNLHNMTEAKKIERLDAEKAKLVRDVEVVGLKGRNTAPSFVSKFKYHSKKDYFVES